MSELDWKRMSVQEKLDWLRAAINGIIDTDHQNIHARADQNRAVVSRLDAVEAAVRDIAREVRRR
jgi:hypothetical protein